MIVDANHNESTKGHRKIAAFLDSGRSDRSDAESKDERGTELTTNPVLIHRMRTETQEARQKGMLTGPATGGLRRLGLNMKEASASDYDPARMEHAKLTQFMERVDKVKSPLNNPMGAEGEHALKAARRRLTDAANSDNEISKAVSRARAPTLAVKR